jgi:hypothetical protein
MRIFSILSLVII